MGLYKLHLCGCVKVNNMVFPLGLRFTSCHLRIVRIISDTEGRATQMRGCGGDFGEVRERSTGFQGVAPAPVRPVWGTHDSGGISPCCSRPLFRGVFFCWQRVRARGEGEEERTERERHRDVGSSRESRRRRRRHLGPGAGSLSAAGTGRVEDLLRSSDLLRNSKCR